MEPVGDDIFSDCSRESYYQVLDGQDPTSWSRQELAQLLRETHREVLPYTSSSRSDVWDALIDLDSATMNDEVHLIYRNVNVSSLEYGTPETWNREHVWPKSRGVGTSGPDYTDIHALRPSDWNVNSARSNLYFGDCGDSCTDIPADDEAAADTAKNGDVFLPPANVRGDVARAILYMELRYSFLDESAAGVLSLTDCPDDNNSQEMAYLSDLLQWHEQDPPNVVEIARNERICSRWQGNRNVFVDYPELVSRLHGEPKSRPYDCNNTPAPTPTPMPSETTLTTSPAPTPATTSSPTPVVPVDDCSNLSAGDVQIVAMNSDNPDSIALVALESLPGSIGLYVTDNAWTGTEFKSNEGVIKMQVPDMGIAHGSIFGYGSDSLLHHDQWESIGSSSFALATAGDSVIVYCQKADGTIHHLGAMISGEWEESGTTTEFTSNQSELPASLSTVGSTEVVGGFDNAAYSGITSGTKAALLEALGDDSNWSGSNSGHVEYTGGNFAVLDHADSSHNVGPSLWCTLVYSLVLCLFLWRR